jgi:hypothetical protein
MDLAVPRSIGRLQYAAARLPFTLLDEWVVARYWGQDAAVRVGFERWLGSLDVFAGRLLADDEITWRGQALIRLTRHPGRPVGPALDAPARPARSGQVRPDPQAEVLQADEQAPEIQRADEQASEVHGQIAAHQVQDDPRQVQQAAGGQVRTGSAPPAADEAPIGDAAGAAGQPGTPETLAASTGAVDVTFGLPADVHAGTVALCGEFNDWSAEDTLLERGSDGSWRATIALQPGRSYRYRYLLDGQRWENDRQAGRYVPNVHGSVDSAVTVE